MIELFTMGRASAFRDGDALEGLLANPSAFALLVHLCMDGPTPQDRLRALWSDEPDEGAEGLSSAILTIRREVGAGCLVLEGDIVRCAEGVVRCDARRLEDAAADGDWSSVDRLHRGPFLANLPLAEPRWQAWRDSTMAHLTRLAKRAASELRVEDAAPSPKPREDESGRRGRRGRLVFQVAAVYLAAAWAAIQVLDTLIERGLAPEWLFAPSLGLAAVGFAVVIVVAWLQKAEVLEGLEKERRSPRWVPDGSARSLVTGLGAAAVLLLGGFWVLRVTVPPTPAAAPDPDLRRVAVLYFDDHSANQSLGPVAAGFTDELIHLLAQIPVLDVASRTGVKAYRDGEISLDSLVSSLNVGTYVEGAVYLAGDSLYATVQLIDARIHDHLASRTLGAPMADVLLLKDEIAEEVARILRRTIGEEVRLRERVAGASDPEAWVLVQRAESRRQDATELRRTDRDAARRALHAADSLLARATARDPEWPTPRVLSGWTAVDLALLESDLPGIFDPEWGRVALERAEGALARHPENPAALELRGRVRFGLAEAPSAPDAAGLYEGALADLEAAVAADSTPAGAWVTLSRLYKRKAQFSEAMRAAERALDSDYYLAEADDVTWSLYEVALELEDAAVAERWCGEGHQRWPDQPRFLLCRLFILASVPASPEEVEVAWRAVDTMVALTPDDQKALVERFGGMFVAQTAAQAGMSDSARAIIRRARGPDPDTLLAYNEAHARLLLGETDLALELLELHLGKYPSRGGRYLKGDWWFSDLRGHPRFEALVARGADDKGS